MPSVTPIASTSKLNTNKNNKKSLLSNSTKSFPQQNEYAPPAQSLKKYSYSAPSMNKNWLGKSSTIKDKKLSHHLQSLTAASKASAVHAYEHDNLLLPTNNAGIMEVENELERTWRVTQDEIVQNASVGVQGKAFSLKLDEFGPYDIDYTRNGRHLAIAGRKGHIGTFDWQSGRLHTELHLKETVRAIRWLHDESFFAVAQKKYVYIYDKDGLEVHQMRDHVEVNRMEFLPYHFLLATIGNAGYLKYQDTSTGQLVSEMRTKLGSCDTMAMNPHNAFIHLGHQNGTVSLWSPSVPRAQVSLLAHRAPVTSIALDPSTLGTRMVTASLDGEVKVWDTRNWKPLNTWKYKKVPKSTAWSGKGMLAIGWGNHISVYNDLLRTSSSSALSHLSPSPYQTHTFPSTAVTSTHFVPFDDLLGVGHSAGFSSLLIPGAGEPNFDSLEADPFEGKRRRREREVNSLLDKIPFDLITLDQDLVGKLAKSVKAVENEERIGYKPVEFKEQWRYARLRASGTSAIEVDDQSEEEEDLTEDEDGEKRRKRQAEKIEKGDKVKKARGRNSTLKKMLRKRKRNVVDPITEALKEKLAKQRKSVLKAKTNSALAKSAASGTAGALDRFGIGK